MTLSYTDGSLADSIFDKPTGTSRNRVKKIKCCGGVQYVPKDVLRFIDKLRPDLEGVDKFTDVRYHYSLLRS